MTPVNDRPRRSSETTVTVSPADIAEKFEQPGARHAAV